MCKDCNENKNKKPCSDLCKDIIPCGCSDVDFCGCDDEVDFKCVRYTGDKLIPLQIIPGMRGDEILKIINDYILDNPGGGTSPVVQMVNVGGKQQVYKGINIQNKHAFRTLDGNEGVNVTTTGDIIISSIDQEWVKKFLTQQWFIDFIKSLFTSGAIDICELIEDCVVPVDGPPTMNGDVVYNVGNRSINFPISSGHFTIRYSDPEGDAFVAIKITGGNLVGLVKGDSTPLAVGDIIPVAEISLIKYNSPNQNEAVSQVVTYVAINSKGQQSN